MLVKTKNEISQMLSEKILSELKKGDNCDYALVVNLSDAISKIVNIDAFYFYPE